MDYTETNNKLIAEFMGIEYNPEDGRFYGYEWDEHNNGADIHDVRYDESWDWIMPVIEKIDKTPVLSSKDEIYYYCVELQGSFAQITDPSPKVAKGTIVSRINNNETNWLETTYQLVIDFINWYNGNK